MNKIAFVFVLLFLSLFSFGQHATLSPDLQRVMDQSKNSQTEQIAIYLWDQVDLESYKIAFDKANLLPGERAKRLQSILSKHALKSQKPLVQFLQKKSAGQIQQFWIANMLIVDVPIPLVNDLVKRTDIKYIMLDSELEAQLIKPHKMEAASAKSIGGTEPGLLAINADKMWALGYTGRGRILYTMDTGIWPDNPALGKRFLGYYYPMESAWLGFDSKLPRDKGSTHGTHVTGTVCGLDRATNDTIGVAFNAYFMVSDPIVTNIADIKPYSDFALAFQWAFNPDGDTNTTYDIPDVINNSWGRGPTKDTNLCHSPVSQMLSAIETAGIANVFSAGNEGPGDTTISEPHHISTGLVNTFTVGAVDPHNASYPIANFSSRGPTVCISSGSLQIKPEVSAPGVNVRSCIGHDNYAAYSGTSMAAPHTSGAVLLLKEAFPFLTGEQILLSLYHTAIDLGVTGEDNTYGMGMIDVWAAYQYLNLTHTPVPPLQSTVDISIEDIKMPFDGFSCDSVFDIKVIVSNKGTDSISDFIVSYWVNSSLKDTIHWNNKILAGQKDSLTLNAIYIQDKGDIEFFVRVEPMVNTIELDPINNQSVSRFNIRPAIQVPFIEDFEFSSLSENGWYVSNPDNANMWDIDSCGGIQFGTQSAMMSCFNYNPKQSQQDIMLSPVFDMPANGKVTLRFKYAYSLRHNFFPDTLKISLVKNCDIDNKVNIWTKGGDDLETLDTIAYYFIPTNKNHWKDVEIDLSNHVNTQGLMLAFESINRSGNNIWIDQVKVYEGNNVPQQITEPASGDIKVYPNPTHDQLFVENKNGFEEGSILTIFDMNGRVIFQKKIENNTFRSVVSTQAFNKGMYVLRIHNQKEIKHIVFSKID